MQKRIEEKKNGSRSSENWTQTYTKYVEALRILWTTLWWFLTFLHICLCRFGLFFPFALAIWLMVLITIAINPSSPPSHSRTSDTIVIIIIIGWWTTISNSLCDETGEFGEEAASTTMSIMSATTMMTDSQCSVIWWYELLNIYYCNAITLYNNYQTCNTLSTPDRCLAIRPLAWRGEMRKFDAFNVPSKIEGERCVIFCHYQSDKC